VHPINPFSSRWIRPGANPYLFPADGPALANLVSHVAGGGFLEIVGPHGSGKSTLVEALLESLAARGAPWRAISLHDGGETIVARRSPGRGRAVVVVDGYEQLGWVRRRATRLRARLLGRGLVVTVHRPLGLGRVFSTTVTPELAVAIAGRLLERAPGARSVRATDVLPRLRAHAGNLREALFDLYDAYQPELSRMLSAGSHPVCHGAPSPPDAPVVLGQ